VKIDVTTSPRWMLCAGRLLSFLPVAVLLSSAWVRATHHTNAVAEIVAGYGYPESAIVPIVIAECVLVVLYLVPQTAVFAAIVMTGYLGGAVAAHLRVADSARAAIPLVVGILAWGGLYLRDSRIRELVPFRRTAS
jgi:DoxX-like family